MKLTKNFSFKEMTFSDTAIRKNIDNTPGLEEAINLTNVCNNILQPVRDHFGKVVRIKYCSQINIRPPTFLFFTNLDKATSKTYQRYMLNSLRDSFQLDGVPIRILFKKGKNPYTKA